MAVAVVLGAFGAHGLRERVTPRALEIWETAARYQIYHALGLIALSLVAARTVRPRAVRTAGLAFGIGTLLFSGSLYGYVLTEVAFLPRLTPIGGLAFMIGWVAFAFSARET